MTRRHTLAVAALLALSAAAGSFGLARTLELGAASAAQTTPRSPHRSAG